MAVAQHSTRSLGRVFAHQPAFSSRLGHRNLEICSSSSRQLSRQYTRGSVLCKAVEEKTRQVPIMRPNAPVPYSEKDPYALPKELNAIQKNLMSLGWNKEWVEQITDRIMKKQLRTNMQRTTEVVDYLLKLGLRQDEICNMAFISIPLLGLNPQKQLQPVVDYLLQRGVPADTLPGLFIKHPKLFEYQPLPGGEELSRPSTGLRARVRVDVVPVPDGSKLANVSYYRTGASFSSSPISPWQAPSA